MTIEKSSATKEVSPASRGDVKASKSKVMGTEPSDGGVMGDFMAILSTFDAQTSSATPAIDPEACTLVPQEALQEPTQFIPSDALQTVVAADAAWQDVTQAGTLLLNQALQVGVPQPAAPSTVEHGADGVALMPQGVAGARAPVAASDAAAKGVHAALAGQNTGPADLQQEAPSTVPSTSQRDKAHASASMALSSAAAGSAWVAPAEIQTVLDARMGAIASKVDAMLNATATTSALLANTDTPVHRGEDRRERFVFKPSITEGVTLASPTGVSAAMSLDVPGATAMPLDVYVAEQVKYWISHDVKNAEMKLDGPGGEMVEVSIRMHGNEAHVAFRSDESQTRAALETASVHLKDMLQREGVVLSGVSVGSSGAQDAGAQARREQQGAGQSATRSVPVEVAPELREVTVRQMPGPGRSVDLFV